MHAPGPPLPPSRDQLGAVRRSSSSMLTGWVEARSAAHPRGARVACAGGCPAPYSRPVGGREAWRARIGARSSPCRRPGACVRSNTVSASSGCPRMSLAGVWARGFGARPVLARSPRRSTGSVRSEGRNALPSGRARRVDVAGPSRSTLAFARFRSPRCQKFRPPESWRVPSTKTLIDAAPPCERGWH